MNVAGGDTLSNAMCCGGTRDGSEIVYILYVSSWMLI